AATSSGTSSVTFTMAGISPTPWPAPANPRFSSGDAQDQIHTPVETRGTESFKSPAISTGLPGFFFRGTMRGAIPHEENNTC
ncbi:hypothetical protein, partial [Corallococcus sp. RDP092CA]|uniref:hypothetical protein n=1 Tax=Corallococcus sp. RDP092CA TaxID=3109369 RepID=UPI0035B38BBD